MVVAEEGFIGKEKKGRGFVMANGFPIKRVVLGKSLVSLVNCTLSWEDDVLKWENVVFFPLLVAPTLNKYYALSIYIFIYICNDHILYNKVHYALFTKNKFHIIYFLTFS